MDNKTRKKGLLDKLHVCLVCCSKAYEYKKGCFICSNKDCKFEWRVN